MEISAIATIIGVGIAALGVGVTIVVLLIRGSYQLGRNTAQVESLGNTVEELRAEIREVREELRAEIREVREELRTEIRQVREEAREDNRQLRADMVAGFERLAEAIDALRVETQQNNQTLAALANHTHDTDGRTLFTVPSPPAR